MLTNSRSNLLGEVQQKGGLDQPLSSGQVARLIAQKQAGLFQIRAAGHDFKDLSMDEVSMNIQQFIPRTGFLPVTLISRGIRAVENSYADKMKQATPMQLKKRPRYTIDTSIAARAEELFRDIIQPRLGLLDSEQAALSSLSRVAGLQRGPLTQLPMSDQYSDKVFQMLDDQYNNYALNQNFTPVADDKPAALARSLDERLAPDHRQRYIMSQLGFKPNGEGEEEQDAPEINDAVQEFPNKRVNRGGRGFGIGTIAKAGAVGALAFFGKQAFGQEVGGQQSALVNPFMGNQVSAAQAQNPMMPAGLANPVAPIPAAADRPLFQNIGTGQFDEMAYSAQERADLLKAAEDPIDLNGEDGEGAGENEEEKKQLENIIEDELENENENPLQAEAAAEGEMQQEEAAEEINLDGEEGNGGEEGNDNDPENDDDEEVAAAKRQEAADLIAKYEKSNIRGKEHFYTNASTDELRQEAQSLSLDKLYRQYNQLKAGIQKLNGEFNIVSRSDDLNHTFAFAQLIKHKSKFLDRKLAAIAYVIKQKTAAVEE